MQTFEINRDEVSFAPKQGFYKKNQERDGRRGSKNRYSFHDALGKERNAELEVKNPHHVDDEFPRGSFRCEDFKEDRRDADDIRSIEADRLW